MTQSRHHALYNTRRWRHVARYQLMTEPLCRFCLERGTPEPATVVDHVVPHHGDITSFWTGKLQSLCKRCHDGRKGDEERLGYQRDVGLDGLPLDPRHPFNRPRR
jgi:5-methylcytosine-specific restriction protein A